MKITQIRPAELDDGLRLRWRELQSADPSLANPYFSVEYTDSVAAVRNDVFVALLEAEGAVQAFFPYQRKSASIGGPVGGRLSDYQGVIAARDFRWDPVALLRGCRLKIWDFDHLLASQLPFARFATCRQESPIAELAEGFDVYLERRKAAGSQLHGQLMRKSRKFEREIGKLRFDACSRDLRAFRQVIQWKSEQCRRTGVPDFMTWGWTTGMLEAIWAKETADFAGVLSVLWHEDEIVAAHFGMRSRSVCHWWFPTYNAAYARYSPGGILLLKLAEEMAANGIRHVDLGKGDDGYKAAFATGSVGLMEGSAMVPSLIAGWRRTRDNATAVLRRSPLLGPARAVFRHLRYLCDQHRKRGSAKT